MNEIQKTNPTGVMTVAAPATIGFNFFDPVQFETMQRVSKAFALSELVPDNYKAKLKDVPKGASPEVVAAIQAENKAATDKAIVNCMIAIETSMRIGASPLMVMNNLAIIYGRPSWSSKFLIATVNSCGRFEPLKFRFTDKGNMGNIEYVDYEWNPQTRQKEPVKKVIDGRNVRNLECVAYTTAKGSKEVLESAPVSIELAVQERWYAKNGSKWQTMPRQMLMYRAASMWTSVFAPELSMGMKTVEEQQDIVDVEFEEYVEPKPTPTPKTEKPRQADHGDATISMANPNPAPVPEEAPKPKSSPIPEPDFETENPGF